MLYKTEQEFITFLKAGPPPGVFMLAGDEPYLKQLYKEKLLQKYMPDQLSDLNYHMFDDKNFSLQEFLAAVENLPCFASSTLVLLDLFSPDTLSAGEIEALAACLADAPDTTAVVIVLAPYYKYKTGEDYKKLKKSIEPKGCIFETAPRTRADMVKFIKARAKKNGCPIETPACSLLLDLTEGDLMQLSSEVDKLSAYAAGRAIEPQDIERLCTGPVNVYAFDLCKAIISRQFDRAIHVMNDARAAGQEPIMLLGALSSAFVDLYRVKLASGLTDSDKMLEEKFDYKKNDFKVKNARRDSGIYSAGSIYRILDILMQTDLMLKSARIDGYLLLERSIAQIFSVKRQQT